MAERKTLLIPSLLDDWFPLLRYAFASERWEPVLLTEDAALLPKGDIACRIENGQTVLRERAEFVEEEVHGLV